MLLSTSDLSTICSNSICQTPSSGATSPENTPAYLKAGLTLKACPLDKYIYYHWWWLQRIQKRTQTYWLHAYTI